MTDWGSPSSKDIVRNLLNAANEIQNASTRPVANQVVISNNLYGKLQQLFSCEHILLKVSLVEIYD